MVTSSSSKTDALRARGLGRRGWKVSCKDWALGHPQEL